MTPEEAFHSPESAASVSPVDRMLERFMDVEIDPAFHQVYEDTESEKECGGNGPDTVVEPDEHKLGN